MTSDDRFGSQSQTGQNQIGQSQTATSPGARSPEFDDGLTVQDTSHSAVTGHGSDTLGGQGSTAGTDGGSMGSGATDGATGGVAGTASHHAPGDNRDGLGRDRTDAVTADETGTLISADKVVGTAVYDASGERLGTIDSIMLNKRSGKVAYAVMSFGGFLGIGERYHPLPWDVLTYDEGKGGYNIQHSADDLRRAPNYSRDEVSSFGGGSRNREVDDYYGVNVAHGAAAEAGTTRTFGSSGTGIEAADAIGSTTGAGSTGMGSTGMGANRNF